METELARLRDLLAARPEVRRVILFGSLAAGRPGETSDLDLAVVAESDLPFLDRYAEYVCYLKPRVSLDLLVYTPDEWRELVADSRLVRRIAGEGRVLYETAA
ncbi:MAG: nucleotidyltransferase domain-containing protein [Candidatus Latescibacterota bacterium]